MSGGPDRGGGRVLDVEVRAPVEPDREPGATSGPAGRSLPPMVLALTLALVGSALLGIALGPTTVPLGDTFRYLEAAITGGSIRADEVAAYSVVWEVRSPRVLLAVVVGAGLSMVGTATQAMVRNALADPYVLGISSGASVGACLVVVFGMFTALGVHALSVAAFGGALAAAALVFLAARGTAGLNPLRLVLTGIATAYALQAVTSLLVFLSPRGDAARTVLYWTLGGLGTANWASLPVAAVVTGVAFVLLWRSSRSLDVLSMGDETSASLGIDGTGLRRRLFVLTAGVTGVLVAVSGVIGFVGLIIPHLVRMLVGSGHRRVLVVAPLVGGCFLVWVDLLCRVVIAPLELPIGVVTALVGVPVFITLMRRRDYLFGGR
ncbi:FecCD family ABC transporter permease [Micromonospora sp. NPDC050187]|uniref:FecCD family ABC transporter permease n=1 Tax=Micromonospora sp. NPDC050187 TaxID=3364277 RepID=UPI0037BD24D9